jgi:hypothetical protein
MTRFSNYESAATQSLMLFQGAIKAANDAHTAETGGRDDDGAASDTRNAAIKAAEAQHFDRLTVAGQAFHVSNGSPGSATPLAQAWLAEPVVVEPITEAAPAAG